jgi:hypothetical protein
MGLHSGTLKLSEKITDDPTPIAALADDTEVPLLIVMEGRPLLYHLRRIKHDDNAETYEATLIWSRSPLPANATLECYTTATNSIEAFRLVDATIPAQRYNDCSIILAQNAGKKM